MQGWLKGELQAGPESAWCPAPIGFDLSAKEPVLVKGSTQCQVQAAVTTTIPSVGEVFKSGKLYSYPLKLERGYPQILHVFISS